jgi:glyoxylase-like metal-dependent hydrolase (beta-lactamase superfamily II)
VAARARRDDHRPREHAPPDVYGHARRRLEVHLPGSTRGRAADHAGHGHAHAADQRVGSRRRALRPSHTDTDVSVHLTGPDVLCAGDTWWNGLYPFIDYSTGGSIDGTIRAAGDTLSRVGASTIIVPGHGPVGRAGDLERYRDVLGAIRERVATLKRQGRSADEVVAAKPTAAFDAAYTGGPVGPDGFARLVYQGV